VAIIGRDAATGLPAYEFSPRFGLASHEVTICTPPEADVLGVVLVLRRFLRGYDRIRVGRPDEVVAQVYCEPGEVAAVARRIGLILGPAYTARVGASVLPGCVQPLARNGGAPGPLPMAASLFFGKRLRPVM
jgi:hypothetical protein